jgi:hypothetical protein
MEKHALYFKIFRIKVQKRLSLLINKSTTDNNQIILFKSNIYFTKYLRLVLVLSQWDFEFINLILEKFWYPPQLVIIKVIYIILNQASIK